MTYLNGKTPIRLSPEQIRNLKDNIGLIVCLAHPHLLNSFNLLFEHIESQAEEIRQLKEVENVIDTDQLIRKLQTERNALEEEIRQLKEQQQEG